MRWNDDKTTCSPDDGDQVGFLAMLRELLKDRPLKDADIVEFAASQCIRVAKGTGQFRKDVKALRKPGQWAKECEAYCRRKEL
jgi:hypothetical protein